MLHAGDYCGEMSLLTGEPRSATVIASTDCEVWQIGKEVLAEILQENDTLVQKLGELLAQRRLDRRRLGLRLERDRDRDQRAAEPLQRFAEKLVVIDLVRFAYERAIFDRPSG